MFFRELDALGFEMDEKISKVNEKVYRAEIFSKVFPLREVAHGLTQESAEERAYNNLIARVQGDCWYLGEFSRNFKECRNFGDTPAELRYSLEEIIDTEPVWIEAMKAITNHEDNFMDFHQILNTLNTSTQKHDELFQTQMFKNLTTNKNEIIPTVLTNYFGKEDMVFAGKSLEEATISGISKLIMYRHMMMIGLKKITPPNVPESILKKYPDICEAINEIKSNKNIQITLKDCSLDTGFPVIATILIDTRAGRYNIHYGASPYLKTALEESVCGVFDKAEWSTTILSDINFSTNNETVYKMRLGKSVNYHQSFFNDAPSCKSSLEDYITPSPEDAFTMTKEYLTSRNANVYIRDISLAGRNGCQLFVPEMWKFSPDINSYIRLLNLSFKCVSSLHNLNDAGYHDLEMVKKIFVRLTNVFRSGYIGRLFKRPYMIEDEEKGLNYFLFVIEYLQNNNEESLKHLHRLEGPSCSDRELAYYACVSSYITMQQNFVDDETIKMNLERLFEKSVANDVIATMSDKKKLVSKWAFACNSFNCSECSNKFCKYPLAEQLYDNIYKLKHEKTYKTFSTKETSESVNLSDRELEILELYTAGIGRKQIADELYISENTVKRHLSNIFRKLDVSSRSDVIAKCKKLNIGNNVNKIMNESSF